MILELKKLLKKSSVSKSMGTSVTILSVCSRILKSQFNAPDIEGYIRHNILFLKNFPREANISLYQKKQQVLSEINKELTAYDFKYTLKDIIAK